MQIKKTNYLYLFVLIILSVSTLFTSCDKDGYSLNLDIKYDVLQINGKGYACFGNHSLITYSSDWDLSRHCGTIRLPCGNLSDAEKGEWDYDYMFEIYLEGKENLKKGSKLEHFSPEFEQYGKETCEYVSGSATIVNKKDDDYITVKFESFSFSSGNSSYVLDGTVTLSLDED